MGRILSSKDVKLLHQSGGWSDETIHALVKLIRHELSRDKHILGAVLCGSVVMGDVNPRSDVDCLVVYDFACKESALNTLKRIAKVVNNHGLEMQFVARDNEIVRTRMHDIGPGFYDHLRQCVEAGGVIISDPLPLLSQVGIDRMEDLRGYIRQKSRYFSDAIVEASCCDNRTYLQILEKALTLPCNLGRKMLAIEGHLKGEDSKRTVIKLFRERILDQQLVDLFNRLVSADAGYTTFLLGQIDCYEKDIYLDYLERMYENVENAQNFARLCALRYK